MNNIFEYILGGLLVVCLIVGGVLWVQKSNLEKQILTKNAEITTLSVQNSALQSSNNDLKKSIENQNESLAKLGKIQESVNALFANFNDSLASTNKQIASIKSSVNKEQVPATCKDTIQYLKDARREFK